MSELQHLAEFQAILKDYKMSEESLKTLHATKLALLVGPASAGRNTIIRKLLKTGQYHFLITDTTRSPRVNDGIPERDGVEYWFRNEDEALEGLKAGTYVEAAIVHNHGVYGSSIQEFRRAERDGKIAITDIEIAGADTMVAAKPNTIAIFVIPPSFAVWQDRLQKRGKMSDEEFRNRMLSAHRELAAALNRDYFKLVLNDEIDHAVEQVHALAYLNQVDTAEQERYKVIAEQLYEDVIKHINAV